MTFHNCKDHRDINYFKLTVRAWTFTGFLSKPRFLSYIFTFNHVCMCGGDVHVNMSADALSKLTWSFEAAMLDRC